MLDRELKILQGFEPISLDLMEEVALLDREDTKYILSRRDLPRILESLCEQYYVLEIEGNRASHYKTLYFDDDRLEFYHLHQRGKRNRVKIRMRQYVDSALTFLEVKHKNNKGRTVKLREEVSGFSNTLNQENLDFIHESYPLDDELRPQILNDFHRITLVHKTDQERLTLDLDLSFVSNDGSEQRLDELVIAELKQTRFDRETAFAQLAKHLHIRPYRVSKYCLGVALLIDSAKKNQMKQKLRRIAKVVDDRAA